MNHSRTNLSFRFSLRRVLSTGPLTGLILLMLVRPLLAQLSVGPNGLGPLTFDVLPSVTQWSTRSVPGTGDPVTNAAGMDAAVQTNSLALLDTILSTSSTLPPGAGLRAQWNSTGLFLQTRPVTGNSLTLLLARLRNDTGSNLASVVLSYQLGILLPSGGVLTESVPGHRVYFSLTGATGSWVHVPAFDSASTNDVGLRTASLPVGNWMANSNLYVLWADDNGPGGTTVPSVEGGNTIDDLRLTGTPVAPEPVIAAFPASQVVAPGTLVTFAPVVAGAEPLSFQWHKNGQALLGATNQNLILPQVSSADNGSYTLAVSNAYGLVTSPPATLEVVCFEPAYLLSNPLSQNLAPGGNLFLSVTATGTPPLTYHWTRNGTPLAATTNGQFQRFNMQVEDAGFYRVAVSNCGGPALSVPAAIGVAGPFSVPVTLTNHLWRYWTNRSDPGTNWLAPGFDDSAWPAGVGLLGNETDTLFPIRTLLPVTDAHGGLACFYFRSTMVLTQDPSLYTLVCSNYLDDGAVVYVNGREAFRYNMPDGPITASSLAIAANPAGEGVPIVSNLPPSLFNIGTNVLAVRVHQSSLTSPDVLFAQTILAIQPPATPMTLTTLNPSPDLVVDELRPVTLGVAAQGFGARFQWFKDGQLLPGATRPFLELPPVTAAQAGVYLLQASNAFGVVSSRFFTVSLNRDLTPPRLLSTLLLSNFHLTLTFDEPVHPSLLSTPANLSVTNLLGSAATVVSASLTSPTNLTLILAGLAPDQNYLVTLRQLTDLAPHPNTADIVSAPVTRELELVRFDHPWRFFDPFPPFEEAEIGPAWLQPDFVDPLWGFGPGVFSFASSTPAFTALPINTLLGQTPTPISYFRASFQNQLSPGSQELELVHAVDDGAVFYLNGVEIYRVNVPVGPVTAATTALTNRNVTGLVRVTVPSERLQLGANVLAASLHQVAAYDTDKYFAARLITRSASFASGPVRIHQSPANQTVFEGQPVTFNCVQQGGLSLQWQRNGVALPGAHAENLTLTKVPLAWDEAEFRLVATGAAGSVTSAVARLTVRPDSLAPTLLSAAYAPDASLVLDFSEPITELSATNLSHYALTNHAGVTLRPALVEWQGARVILRFAGPTDATPFLRVQELRDQAVAGNLFLQSGQVIPGFAGKVVEWASTWRYDVSATDLSIGPWFSTSYDDSAWSGSGPGLLDGKNGGRVATTLPLPVGTVLPAPTQGPNGAYLNTVYFRTWFTNFSGATEGRLSLRVVLDDAAVLYLNGAPFHRVRMPDGPLNYATQGSGGATGDAIIEEEVSLVVTNLSPGPNLLAVEVHQIGTSSGDVTWGAELSVNSPTRILGSNASAAGPALRLLPWGSQLGLTWDGDISALETAPEPFGPWTILPHAGAAFFVSPTNGAAFYRLRR